MNLEPKDVKQLNDKKLKPGVYQGARPVGPMPVFNHEYTVVVPKHAKRLDPKIQRKMRTVNGQRVLVSGAYNRDGKLKSALGDRSDVGALRKRVDKLKMVSSSGSTQAARDAAKISKDFKTRKYPGVIRNMLGKGKNSNSYARSQTEKLTKKKMKEGFDRTPGGKLRVDLSAKESDRVMRIKRDRLAKAKDAVAIGSSAAMGVGSVMAGRAALKAAGDFKKTSAAVRKTIEEGGDAARAVGKSAKTFDGRQVVGEVSKRAKKHVKKAFPTVTKVARAMTKRRRVRLFDAYEFAGRDQLKDSASNQYAKPLRVASGLQKAYKSSDVNKAVVDVPVAHAQVVRAAYNKGKKIERVAGRGGRLARDVGDVVARKERRKDAAGRKKKREWEKGYFKKAVGSAVAGAGLLGYTAAMRKNPNLASRNKMVNKGMKKVLGKNHGRKMRDVHQGVESTIKRKVNKYVPDTFADLSARKMQDTRLQDTRDLGCVIDVHLVEFDVIAKEAGWDVRDPRGRSARVFAPGSKKRVRREKKWHEKTENERKLWKAGMVGALVVGGAAGARMARRSQRIKGGSTVTKGGGSKVVRPSRWNKQKQA